MYYVYMISNLVNDKLYIGKCADPDQRWSRHLTAAKNGKPGDGRYQVIHAAMNKYGAENFKLKTIASAETEAKALDLEKQYIKKYNTFKGEGYNCTEGGDGASGYRHNKKTKQKMSQIKRKSYLGQNNPFYGKTHSKETRRKISEVAKQRTGPKNSFYGKQHTKESRRKMKANHYQKKRYFSFEQAEEIRKTYHTSDLIYSDLAQKYNTNKTMIKNILRCYRGYASDKKITKYPPTN